MSFQKVGISTGNHNISAGSFDISDDEFTSITPSRTSGMIALSCKSSGLGCLVGYDCGASSAIVLITQDLTQFEVGTGLIDETGDGTDGKFTIKAHTDGKLYFLHRLGSG